MPPRCRTWKNFYPRPPRGGRQVDRSGRVVTRVFLSTPSARRATLQCLVTWSSHRYFYPRPPRGGRLVLVWSRNSSEGFLSTPSARRATNCVLLPCLLVRYFYPRPPRGGRPGSNKENNMNNIFLSTPSARRATSMSSFGLPLIALFLSTPSARRATKGLPKVYGKAEISIHALREEGDSMTGALFATGRYFYPRPPRGGRLQCERPGKAGKKFLSTPSARRATSATCSTM